MATVAYLRVSTASQSLDSQRHAMTKAGIEPDKEFVDEGVSGRKAKRPGLDACLDYLREGDTLVIYSLSRLGRSTRHLLTVLEDLQAKGVTVRSLTESLDTSTPGGRLVITVLAAVAEMEADITRERVTAGVEAARAQGRQGGRPPALSYDDVLQFVKLRTGQVGVAEAGRRVGIARATAYKVEKALQEGRVIKTLDGDVTVTGSIYRQGPETPEQKAAAKRITL